MQSGPRPPGDLNPRLDPPLDFPDADYGELSVADYQALGFMAGLEVHQQLQTRSKLFCRCPAGCRAKAYDAEVLRHMRPTLSELGEYDGTALMEFKTRKEIVYQLERNSVCTYEMDDTPPFGVDQEAVWAALEIAQLLDLNLVSELHVMRKQYLDGSIPTGFQRTAMVGLNGTIPFKVPELLPPYLRQFTEILQRTSGIRRAGAASLDFVDLALGRVDGFWELYLAPWDVAAGALIVREAGGFVSGLDGDERPLRRGGYVAGNPKIYQWLMELLTA